MIGFASDGADGTITRVEIEILDLASGLILNDGPGPVTNFVQSGPGYSWSAVWDTSKLIHERQYEIRVKAYDGEDYSVEDVVRITISKPSDANNIPPQFNATSWPNQIVIFCVVDSNSENQCGNGGSIDLKDYFVDPDSSFDELSIDFYDDLTDPTDDTHQYFIDIDRDGVATYDPSIKQSNEDITTWTIENVRFIVRDKFDESAISRDVTFFVTPIEFGVSEYTTSVSASTPATFNGTGLPGARVVASSLSGIPIKTAIVDATGTWSMEINLQNLGQKSRDITFEMDGQTLGGNEPTSFSVSVDSGDEGSNLFLIIAIVVVGILLLGAVGYFFIEFEELDDEDLDSTQEYEEKVDPYAWGKKEVVSQPQQTQAESVAEQSSTPQQSAQHPGWLWDQENNQWVPDPNYQPPAQ